MGLFTFVLRKNGATIGHLKDLEYNGAAGQTEQMLQVSAPVGSLLAGDYIEVWVQHDQAGTAVLTAWDASLALTRIA